MQAILRRQANRLASATADIARKCVAGPLPCFSAPQQKYTRLHSTTQNAVPLLDPDTDVEAAVLAAVTAVGRNPGQAEAELAKRLKENLYFTARDVAAMSPEELDVLNVPVKLWAVLNEQMRSQQLQQLIQHQAPQSSAELGVSSSSVAPLPADLMDRRLPPTAEKQDTEEQYRRVRHTPLRSTKPYGLQEQDLTPALHDELAALERFCTTRWFGQLAEPIQPVTYRTVTKHYAMLLLGYAHRVTGVPLKDLCLQTLVPSPGREGVALLLGYQRWRLTERGTAPSTATVPIKAATHIARFLYHGLAKPPSETKLRPYHDLEVVQELNTMQRAASKAAAGADRVADERKKWLEWDDYLTMVQALRAECAGLSSSGKPRSRQQVAKSLQRYLIVAILSVVPDRQRTLRELEIGRTLLRRDDETWVIKHGASDYKTGKQYGDRPPMLIAPFIYPELEAFINTWRQELNPKTNKLFCRPGSGEPLTERCVYSMFKHAAVRLTGKATHPHLIRDMIVTHLKMQNKSESVMEALALYMGHSISMQRSTYDRRSKAQKVTPAVELLQGLWQD